MKHIFILIIPLISSCSTLIPQQKALLGNKQLKTKSTIIISDKEQYELPFIISRSKESAIIEADPKFVVGGNSALQGYKFSTKTSIEHKHLRTKGSFTIYHYRNSQAPKSQSVKFDFSSQSGQVINIPIQIGYPERHKQLTSGVNSKGQDYYKESFIDVPPKKATLRLSILKIDAFGQLRENKSQ